ncbi:hypothetical protein M0805_008631 [Coniferiporia weirii]|nr:hypothetical protein M0805_008631 [Coniferiporia weirii]
MMNPSTNILLALLPLAALAANDWSKPCLYGECAYDIPASENSMAASLLISGSPYSISDITTAAGWEILNCSSNVSTQDIRLVCSGDDASCVHIFQNGAEHTIVRLPEECGKGPFARVSRAWVSEDQDIPEYTSSRIVRRDGTTPVVHAISLDTDFGKATSSRNGNVSLVVYGSNMRDAIGNASITAPSSRLRSRDTGCGDLDSVITSAFNSFESVSSSTTFQRNQTSDSIPFQLNQPFNVFNQTLVCSDDVQAKLSVDVIANVQGQLDLGVVAEGTIIPPQINSFGVFASLSADLDGTLNFVTDLAGELDSGQIPLFTIGLPGLSIPDIVNIGPLFALNAEATASLDIDMELSVNLAYSVDNLSLFFPPSFSQSSSASATPKDIPLALSVTPGVTSNATLEAHLIPALEFGIEAFGVTATVFLDFDTAAILDLGLDASTTGSVDSGGTTSTSDQVDGCVTVQGGISIDVGAEGEIPFFSLFGDSFSLTLFSKNFDFFQQCFPTSASAVSTSAPSPTDATVATPKTSFTNFANIDSLISNSTGNSTTNGSCPTAPPSLFSAFTSGLTGSRRRQKRQPSFSMLSRRDLSCSSGVLSTLSTVVNQTLSSAGFSSL